MGVSTWSLIMRDSVAFGDAAGRVEEGVNTGSSMMRRRTARTRGHCASPAFDESRTGDRRQAQVDLCGVPAAVGGVGRLEADRLRLHALRNE